MNVFLVGYYECKSKLNYDSDHVKITEYYRVFKNFGEAKNFINDIKLRFPDQYKVWLEQFHVIGTDHDI